MRKPIDSEGYISAHWIYKTIGIHAHALKTAALRDEIRTRPSDDGQTAVLYHSGDAKAWADGRSEEERERFAAAVERFRGKAAGIGQESPRSSAGHAVAVK